MRKLTDTHVRCQVFQRNARFLKIPWISHYFFSFSSQRATNSQSFCTFARKDLSIMYLQYIQCRIQAGNGNEHDEVDAACKIVKFVPKSAKLTDYQPSFIVISTSIDYLCAINVNQSKYHFHEKKNVDASRHPDLRHSNDTQFMQ